MEKEFKNISKFMSLVLRHKPDLIGLQLNENGWANVQELIDGMCAAGLATDRSLIEFVVETNDKKRFAFNEDKTMIRASQGHSVDVELNLSEQEPPKTLYHGTVDKFLSQIMEEGLCKMTRRHVHLSADKETATKVGSRRGRPVILSISAGKMFELGYKFYLSDNGVWLTDAVPPEYILL